jgi:hypothetical protein
VPEQMRQCDNRWSPVSSQSRTYDADIKGLVAHFCRTASHCPTKIATQATPRTTFLTAGGIVNGEDR